MKPNFDTLQVTAALEYIRPVPYYMGIDCELTVRAFVDGAYPVEEELSGLESFRKALIKLVEEGLTHPPSCEGAEQPFINLRLSAGEAHQKPIHEFYLSLGFERFENLDVWRLTWDTGKGDRKHPIYDELAPALDLMKHLLDLKTGEWASRVVFRASRVDS